jgi:hypothetical protein
MKIEMEMLDEHVIFAGGDVTESYLCVDCGVNTAPGCSTKAEVMAKLYRPGRRSKVVGHMRASSKSELYIVRNAVWKKAGMKPWGGCLCVGCLEKRIGRKRSSLAVH